MLNLLYLQVAYYIVTGIWPLVSIDTFQKITGPKTDIWLVKTVGVLVIVIGFTLLFSLISGDAGSMATAMILGVGSAGVLAGIDIVYVLNRRIRPVYLIDAILEIGFVFLWAAAFSPAP